MECVGENGALVWTNTQKIERIDMGGGSGTNSVLPFHVHAAAPLTTRSSPRSAAAPASPDIRQGTTPHARESNAPLRQPV